MKGQGDDVRMKKIMFCEIDGRYLLRFYAALLKAFGHQHWWPADTWFETIIGAVLAQNVSWSGAHTAVQSLQNAGLMTPDALYKADAATIASHIRSSRYYNQKAERILAFIRWFMIKYDGSIENMVTVPTDTLRDQILSLKGFGPETVDSILLYAVERPVFVVDAYTRRIGYRQGWFSEAEPYARMQDLFMNNLPSDTRLFNDFHAQIVRLGNQVCKTKPLCIICPVRVVQDSPCSYYEQQQEPGLEVCHG